MMMPTSGATPSHRPKMKEVFIDVRTVGLRPPSTIEIRKLSRLRVNPRVRSAITWPSRKLQRVRGWNALIDAAMSSLQVRPKPAPPTRGQGPRNLTPAGPALQAEEDGSATGGECSHPPPRAGRRRPGEPPAARTEAPLPVV